MTRKNIRLLHVYKTALPSTIGGVEVFMDTLCNATADLKVDNVILALSDQPDDEPINMEKYQVVHAKQNLFIASTGFSISAFVKFRKLAQEADIIHYHFPNPFADMLHFICKINKPTVLTYHSDIIRQSKLLSLYKPLMKKFLKSVSKIITTSPNYFASSDVLKEYREKVSVIAIGINKATLPDLNKKLLEYWKLRLPKDFFLFVGALRYYKGLRIALDAVKGTNFNLVVAGIGPLEKKLKKYAIDNDLHNVYFLGAISEEDKIVLHYLSLAFVFPSNFRSEAFGISLVEAAALNKPLISCEIGTGTSFVNIDQETGLVIRPSSPEALREAMHFLVTNPSKTMEFGINAEKRYRQLFTAKKQAQAYLEIYEELLCY